MSRKRYIQEYRLENKKVIPYDGRYKHIVLKYKYQDKNRPEVVEIVGAIHKATKKLDWLCCDCMKPIEKGQFYVQKNAMIFADCFRTHSDCQFHYDSDDNTICVEISTVIRNYYKIHKLIVFNIENMKKYSNDNQENKITVKIPHNTSNDQV